jgi:ribonuclease-3
MMSGGEAESGGREKRTILADACEAILGAVLADAGYPPARDIVHRFWTEDMTAAIAAPVDAKTALQEWAQARQRNLPRYVSVDRSGPDHAPVFTIEVQVDGVEPARGEGASKRAAEQAAAAAMLEREGAMPELLDG